MNTRHTLFAAAVALTAFAAQGAPASAVPGGGNAPAAKACRNGGFTDYHRSDGTAFADEGACTSYAARGGTLTPLQTVNLEAFREACQAIDGAFYNGGYTAPTPGTVDNYCENYNRVFTDDEQATLQAACEETTGNYEYSEFTFSGIFFRATAKCGAVPIS